jgi:hypothetical protein
MSLPDSPCDFRPKLPLVAELVAGPAAALSKRGVEMGDVINLRQRRKEKAREARKATAVANRARFGRSLAERLLGKAEKAKAARELDGRRLKTGDDT